jgi:NAD(P)-dependent dehydrogenase (short-subunit alcohol dehydrogenase family)
MGDEARVAVVTGAGRGLGRTIARFLAERGMAVTVVSRTASEVEATADLIERGGGRALAVTADLTDWDEVASVFEQAEETAGPVDLLVNNAGACRAIGPSWALDPGLWWSDVTANLFTTYLCSRAALVGMTARRSGRIVNLGSESGVEHPAVGSDLAAPNPAAMTAYGTSKAAVHQLTSQLAREVGPFGVTVVAIRPGPVRTTMTDAIAERLGVPADSWLPWVDEGQGAADLIWRLAQGEGDALNGRYIRSADELPTPARPGGTR